MSPRRLRICLVGWGAIGRRAAQLLAEREPERIEIAAVAVRDPHRFRPDLPSGTRLIAAPDALAALALDLVVEAAGREAVPPWGEAALASGADLVLSSTSAFCDDTILARLSALAEAAGRQVIVPAGALGGIDALSAASLLPLERVEHRITKPPAAWRGTRAEQLVDLERLREPVAFFAGSAREAAALFPQNANATVITSLAGLGLARTTVTLVADPAARRNGHQIEASGAFGRLTVRLENEALATNPKSSELTALNLVRAIENRVRSLVC